jgi:hypothetical protein
VATDCAGQTAADGQPRSLEITLERQPDGTYRSLGTSCVVTGPPQVTAQMVIDEATRLIPRAAIGIAPQTYTLVNAQTVMWVDAPDTEVLPNATILGQAVRITITLDHVDWTYGDGTTAITPTAGKPYDEVHDPCTTRLCPPYGGHIYTDTGTEAVTAQALWTATFSVAGGNAVAIPGTVAGPTANATITVRQSRGVLVQDPGH